ncbi:MAG: HD domain-containing protein [Phycisphaerales bacterium]|nr:HD domain-containing protein [Phycisphaerales bacterium]
MGRILDIAERNGIQISKEECADLRLAAVLHDIGHYPYSHLFEKVHKVKLTEEFVEEDTQNSLNAEKARITQSVPKYPDHEEVGKLIVTSHKDLVEAIGGLDRAKRIADLFSGSSVENKQQSKLIHSSFDMDRLDYPLRDSHATGVPYGQIDLNYLLNNLKVSPAGMVGISERALPAVEHMLLGRFYMHRTVYFHKTTFGLEQACAQLLRRLNLRHENGGDPHNMPKDGNSIEELVQSEDLSEFTDAYIDQIIHHACHDENTVVAALAQTIASRQPPKLLKEVNAIQTIQNPQAVDIALFQNNCRNKLRTLAEDHAIPLEHFLFCKTNPLRLEKRGHLVSGEGLQDMASDDKEITRVFRDDQEEPISVVDIKHSLLYERGNFTFHTLRLYVVYNESDAVEKVEKLRNAVKDWDKS